MEREVSECLADRLAPLGPNSAAGAVVVRVFGAGRLGYDALPTSMATENAATRDGR